MLNRLANGRKSSETLRSWTESVLRASRNLDGGLFVKAAPMVEMVAVKLAMSEPRCGVPKKMRPVVLPAMSEK